MSYVVYHTVTGLYHSCMYKPGFGYTPFKTEAAAKAGMTRWYNKMDAKKSALGPGTFERRLDERDRAGWFERDQYKICAEKDMPKYTRKTRNLLNPQAGEFDIDVNTPYYLDPGSETYHSM